MIDRVGGGASAVAGGLRSGAMLGAGALAAGTVALASGAVSRGMGRETTRAALETAVGAGKANREFERLSKFAAQTPYDLQQVTAGFVKLDISHLPGLAALQAKVASMPGVAAANQREAAQG